MLQCQGLLVIRCGQNRREMFGSFVKTPSRKCLFIGQEAPIVTLKSISFGNTLQWLMNDVVTNYFFARVVFST